MQTTREHINVLKLEDNKDLFVSYINQSYEKYIHKELAFSSFYYPQHEYLHSFIYHIEKKNNTLYVYNNCASSFRSGTQGMDDSTQIYIMNAFKYTARKYDIYTTGGEFVFHLQRLPLNTSPQFILSKKCTDSCLQSNASMVPDFGSSLINASYMYLENYKTLLKKEPTFHYSAGEYIFRVLTYGHGNVPLKIESMIHIVRDFENTWFISKMKDSEKKYTYPNSIFVPINYDKYLVMDEDTLEVIDATV